MRIIASFVLGAFLLTSAFAPVSAAPAASPATKPAAKPAMKPAAKPAMKPAAKKEAKGTIATWDAKKSMFTAKDSTGKTWSFMWNKETKVDGKPAVGAMADVMYTTDKAGKNWASTIKVSAAKPAMKPAMKPATKPAPKK